MPLFRDPIPCDRCRHHVKFHKKWSRNGALAERCEKEGYFWSISQQRLVKGLCPCDGFIPPKVDYSQLRCVVCKKSVNQHHEVNDLGLRRCQYCGTLFGQDIAHPDLQKELRK